MNRPSKTQPPHLLLRLLQTATSAEPRHPASLRRKLASSRVRDERLPLSAEGQASELDEGNVEGYPESIWERVQEVSARFEAELNFADSFLADDPASTRIAIMLANTSELRRVAIVQRLVERAYSLRLHKPQEGLRIVDDVLACIHDDSSQLIAVFRARALMERGNFLRILGDPDSAKQSFAKAFDEASKIPHPMTPLKSLATTSLGYSRTRLW